MSTVLAVVVGLVFDAMIPALIYTCLNNLGTWLYIDQFPAGHGGKTARLAPYLAAVLLPVGPPLVVAGTNGSHADRSFEHTVEKDYVDPPPPSPTT